jgi:hypothetical protein
MIELKYKESLATVYKKRRLVCGVGINDADYSTLLGYDESGKQIRCPFYIKWKGIIGRCYNPNVYNFPPNQIYKDCSVSEDWLRFSNFRKWISSQDWEGKQIDKDILVPGNKIYSADTCLLVPTHINNLIIDQETGKSGKGVYQNSSGSFTYIVRKNRKRTYKTAKSIDEALIGYRQAKHLELVTEANKLDDERVKTALINYANYKYGPS